MTSAQQFQKTVLGYYKKHGRSLPWRASPTPYHVLVSKIMLQQTQVDRVVPKYNVFIKQFPYFSALAKAPLAGVLKAWSGLGYNRRAVALTKIAKEVVKKYKGALPDDAEKLDALPGIGPATAATIVTYAFNRVAPFIETNVRTVYIHFFFPKKKKVDDAMLWPLIVKTLDHTNPRRWFNALMDYGVKLKKEHNNPARRSAHHTRQSRFEGSNRQMRGQIVRLLLGNPRLTSQKISMVLNRPREIIEKTLTALVQEGLAPQRPYKH